VEQGMRVVAIIQARMGSTRLPGKVLSDIVGQNMIERIVGRVRSAEMIDDIFVATTNETEDDALVAHLQKIGCQVYRGSVHDVLDRYYQCAKLAQADVIVRVTADDPLKDPQIIDQAVRLLLEDEGRDYCSNTIEPSYPEGLDIEVFRLRALEKAHKEANLPSEREHVTPYIWKNKDRFQALNFKFERDLKDWRWTVDKPEDLEFMRQVYKHFQTQPLVSYLDVIAWLEKHPEIRDINQGTIRNEGYIKSLGIDKL
jgi:spore coat polysaccharide biosynthesis protein SpsF (cytidylyltransferase family)